MRWLFALVCSVACLAARSASAEWLRAESEHFVVFSQVSERDTRQSVAELEEYDALLRQVLRITPRTLPPKLEIYLYESLASFRRMREGRNVMGVYTSGPESVSAHAVYSHDDDLARIVLFHEYAHHFMFQHAPGAYPAWVIEGFAEFFSTVTFENDRIVLGHENPLRTSWLAGRPWIPLERVVASRVFEFSRSDRAMFYAQSWFLMHYCQTDPARSRALGNYLEALQSPDADPIAAFTSAFGKTPEQVQRDLRAYMGGYPYYHLPRIAAARSVNITITTLPRSSERLIALDQRLRNGLFGPSDRARLLDSIRREANAHPGDAYATLTGARAEIILGAPADGRALVAPILEASPDNADALYLMGLSHMSEASADGGDPSAAYAAARRYFARAFRIVPRHVPTLFHYAEARYAEPGPMSEEALAVLLTALVLSPQVTEIGVLSALALMEAQRFDEAERVLLPIATNPHLSPDAAPYLLNLLEAARNHDVSGVNFDRLPQPPAADEEEEGGDDSIAP